MGDEQLPQDPFAPQSAEGIHAMVLAKNLEIAEANEARSEAMNKAQIAFVGAQTVLRLALAIAALLLTFGGLVAVFRFAG